MGNGWHEWPLVLFTVLGQCVVGATIVSGLGWLALGDQREARRRLVRNMFFIWLLMGIGFLASVMHLGSPLRAFNSLNRIGASALSNEIASGALFFAVGGFWWLLALGLGCWLCPLIRRQPPRATGLLIGLLLVLIAECIGRGLFYGLHMTVGMAVAG
ncbi:TPA: dimethyl sulfoxide reductase anchor subunit [Klebsiella pneumoniae]|nr:dimethyl sulfoxide reductase anchor subunit [Klebsiella pneumoniae]